MDAASPSWARRGQTILHSGHLCLPENCGSQIMVFWASHICRTCLLLCLAGLLCGRASRPLVCEDCLDPAAVHDDALLPVLNLALLDVHLLAGEAVVGKQAPQVGLHKGQRDR